MAVGTTEKLQIDSIDELAAMIKGWMQSDGKGLELVGRTYDLRKAYRQIGIRGDHLHTSWFCVWCPSEGRVKYFHPDSMPFGATASVSAFLRISVALKLIGLYHCSILGTSFYDDYIVFAKKVMSDPPVSWSNPFSSPWDGWCLQTRRKTRTSLLFQCIGVEVNLTGVPEGYFGVGNTGSRKDEVSNTIDKILLQMLWV